MKACPSCGRLYPLDAGFCPVDGSQLSRATEVPVQRVEDDARVGQLLFERYQVRRVVADGGMGRVYEALDLQEKRNVAIKILHAEVARDPVQVERFKQEFEVSQQLPHEHIVEVLDFRETQDGSYALIMEYLYGEELSATLFREKFLSPARLVRMVSQVAIGLDRAHELNFVHRDLKPDNLFLGQTPDGDIVKILDFGSVKDKTEGAKQLTMMGTTIGSPYYMAPEQAQGLETLDHRADIWALGAICFESVTGRVPFQGQNGPSILLEILTKEVPAVRESAQEGAYPIPSPLETVLQRALKKLASLRYDSVGKFANALGAAYGLEGDHKEWAHLPEAKLAERIESRLPELLGPTFSERPRSIQDDFFGEGDPLGEMPSNPLAASMMGPMSEAMRQARVSEVPISETSLALPTQKGMSPALVLSFVLGGLAVLLVLIVFLVLA